jgi:nucleoside-diphosphate-sugar epimerase
MSKKAFIFGYGYVSSFLCKELEGLGYLVFSTSRSIDIGCKKIEGNLTLINFDDPIVSSILKESSILLSSVPPSEDSDPVLDKYENDICNSSNLEWLGYLSSTSVYGNHNGAWVNEDTICRPSTSKSKIRLDCENRWLNLYEAKNLPVSIFRLSGIYGPKQNYLEKIIKGKDFTISNDKHFFSRIHVTDICKTIIASIGKPSYGEVFNVSDDLPAPINTVQQFCAQALNRKPLKEISIEEANLSEQAKRFFLDNKKVSNDKIKNFFDLKLDHPDYKSGILRELESIVEQYDKNCNTKI